MRPNSMGRRGGLAAWAAAKKLLAQGWLDGSSRIVLFNTGSGFKYL